MHKNIICLILTTTLCININVFANASSLNVVLLGIDNYYEGIQRSDAILIVTFRPGKKILLTSVLRDIAIDIEGYEDKEMKLSDAYVIGGPTLVTQKLEDCLGLDILGYISVGFDSFIELIDLFGGVDVDLTIQEINEINRRLTSHELELYEPNSTLNGAQALAYCRIREYDSDTIRTMRQRRVLKSLWSNLKDNQNPITLIELFNKGYRCVDTSLSFADSLLLLGELLEAPSSIEQFRIPADDTYESGTKDEMWFFWVDFDKNKQQLYELLG